MEVVHADTAREQPSESRHRGARGQLVLAAFLVLFVELVLIRWLGANVLYLAYFSNVVLLGSFLGIGAGFLWASRRRTSLYLGAPAALAAFGANLLGAMLGGLAEYVSLIVGYRHLLLVVGALYAAAFLLRPGRPSFSGRL